MSAKSGISLASSLVVLLGSLASHAIAQEEENNSGSLLEEQVIVTGTRVNLQNAQDIKREADTVVDAISAEDIGALPDRSVLEAIQRMPGVSVERFAGPDDPDHFSVEGSGAIIRGMTQTRSEFNGRDSFTANSGRGLNFQDVSPELMGGVDIYKNQTADMIEGGIGGTISLKTRKPFDQDGRKMAFTLDYSYGDIAEEWSPTFSGLYSDRWDTSLGEFGLLVSYANSELYGETHGIQSDAYVRYRASSIPGGERFQNPDEPDETAYVWMPNSANALKKADDRKRQGASAVIQWADPTGAVEVTGEYFRSDSTLSWHENAIKYQGSYPEDIDDIRSTAKEGTTIEFDDNGLFQGGALQYVNWIADGGNSDHIPSQGDVGDAYPQFGQKLQFDSRVVDTDNLVEDFSLNISWNVTDNLELSGDYQYIQADTEQDDLVIHTGSFAGEEYYLGDTPTLNLVDPWFGARDADPDAYAPGGDYTAGFSTNTGTEYSQPGDADYFQDYNNYFWRSAMEHYERSEGKLAAARFDLTYHFDNSFVTSIKAGIRASDREQLVRRTSWNWKAVGPEWSGSTTAAWVLEDRYADQLGDLELVDWSDFHGGGVVNIPGNKTLHASEEFVRAVRDYKRELIGSTAGDWNSIGTAEDQDPGRYANRYGVDDKYGMFWPGEISYTREENRAFYTRLDFASDGDIRFSGNVGIRYVELDRQSDGSVVYPDLAPARYPPAGISLPLTNDVVMAEMQRQVDEGVFPDVDTALANNPWVDEANAYLSSEDRAFGNGAALPTSAKNDFKLFLPSFNLDGSGDDFTGWSKLNSADTITAVTSDTCAGRGMQAVSAGGDPWSVQVSSPEFDTTIGADYTATMWIKSSVADATMRFSTSALNGAQYGGDNVIGTSWQQVVWNFQPNSDATQLVLDLGASATTYLIDDVKIVPGLEPDPSSCPHTDGGSAGPTNLLSNGGFESGDGDAFTDWTVENGASGVSATAAEVHGGSRALQAVAAGGNEWDVQVTSARADTVVGTTYVASMWVKAAAAGGQVRFSTKTDIDVAQYQGLQTVGTDWTEVSFEFAADDVKTSMVLDLGAVAATYYIDDVSLTEKPAE
ncbi:TonB-dependent receptor [Teredinibacter turnerae]